MKNSYFSSYISELGQILASVECSAGARSVSADEGLSASCDIIKSAAQSQSKILVIGNGGSASIANHLVVDLAKNCRMQALSFSESALLTCLGNDYGYPRIFEEPVGIFARKGDVLVAISSSGKSENILNAVAAAKSSGCKIITLSGFTKGNPLSRTGDINFYVGSMSYGYVETAHAVICHCISDIISGK